MQTEENIENATFYGQNIHLAYNLELEQFAFIHTDLFWIFGQNKENKNLQYLLSLLNPEMFEDAKNAFDRLSLGTFSGSLQLPLTLNHITYWFRIIPFTASPKSKNIILATVENITSEIKDKDFLMKYANKKNSILQMLAHDLRGPLSIANTVVKTIDRKLIAPEVVKKTDYLGNILDESLNLIDSLVSRESRDATANALIRTKVDIVKILKDYWEECKRSSKLADRHFDLRITINQLFIDLDNSKFMLIMNNLLSNALKFTRPGDKITVGLLDTPNTIELNFSDTGIGIPNESLPFIFDEYTSAGRPGLNGEPTMGLGLSIVKAIIVWHGGSIHCESSVETGTTFYISLPKEAS
ncbi:MAG: HAMP domain-containing histidine kinase [Pedobacter sp.]|nr:MAG: HAMP domain-containing histidine kinase [Pedobacter sp.]